MAEKREVLIVTVPAGSIKPDGFGKFRDYIVESVLRGVLVLDYTMKWNADEMPAINTNSVQVAVELDVPAAADEPKMSIKEEKQAILQRLLGYRQRNGVGSLGDVARKTNIKSITADVLRMLVTGDATLSTSEWRAIGRALGKLEEIEQEAAKNG